MYCLLLSDEPLKIRRNRLYSEKIPLTCTKHYRSVVSNDIVGCYSDGLFIPIVVPHNSKELVADLSKPFYLCWYPIPTCYPCSKKCEDYATATLPAFLCSNTNTYYFSSEIDGNTCKFKSSTVPTQICLYPQQDSDNNGYLEVEYSKSGGSQKVYLSMIM